MSYIPGQPVTAVVQRVEIHKLRQGENLILGFSIGGGIDQDPSQNPFSEDKTDKGIYVTRVSEGGPAEIAGLQIGDKIMQIPEGEKLRWLYSLLGPGERLGHDHGHTRPGPEAAHQTLRGGGAPAGHTPITAEGCAAVHVVLAAHQRPDSCQPTSVQ